MPARLDIVGKTFGRLTALSFGEGRYWICSCSCGTKTEVGASELVSGHTKSCGCLKSELAAERLSKISYRHGLHGHPEQRVWGSIKTRCLNKNHPAWKDYGGRGIEICERWRDSFAAFLSDVGPRPAGAAVIDRINNDGNYEPGNVRWTTQKINARNTRANLMITIDGVTKCLAEWSEKSGVKRGTIGWRHRKGIRGAQLLAPAAMNIVPT